MFGFALWDADRRELVLARDRFGKKPLYYAEVGSSLIFGSELKSLLEHPSCPTELDLGSLSRYLALEYVPTPYAIFAGVRKLPGGHVLRWRDGRASVERYWDLAFQPDPSGVVDADDYAEELHARLRDAVRRRLMSDVPLGAFLSGGIDSSSVVAMMVEQMPSRDVKTFSIGFSEQSFDESAHARRVAEHFGTDHHEQIFTPETLIDVLPAVVDVLDEPFADASILPTYVLSRFTRQSVTVALGGDGSDELLAGYPTFPAERVARLYAMPRLLHEVSSSPLVDRLPVSTADFSLDFKVKRFLRGAAAPATSVMRRGSARSRPRSRRLARPRSGRPVRGATARICSGTGTSRTERLIYLYATTYLQDDILVKVDRASMACGLEVRAPFLDVELVEFLSRVPVNLKLRRFDTKHVLKRAMARTLPAGYRRSFQEGIRDSDRNLAQERVARRARRRALPATVYGRRASSTRPRWDGWCPSTSPAVATTASNSGRSSCSSSGTGAGWRSAGVAPMRAPCTHSCGEAGVKQSSSRILCARSHAIRSDSSRTERTTSSRAGLSATAADATGRSAAASRGSCRPTSSSSSGTPRRRSAGSGSTSPSSIRSSRSSSWTGSSRSTAASSRASASSTPDAARVAMRTSRPGSARARSSPSI